MSSWRGQQGWIGNLIARLDKLEARLSKFSSKGTKLVGSPDTTVGVFPSDASAVSYTPAVLTDWDGDADPGDTDDALDQLAERVDDLEAGGGPVDASGVTFTPVDNTDWTGSADPGNVDDALDQLADRLNTVEGSAGHDASEIEDDDGDTGWRTEESANEDILRGRSNGIEIVAHKRDGSVSYLLMKQNGADPAGRWLWRVSSIDIRLYTKTSTGDDFDISKYTRVFSIDQSDGTFNFDGTAFVNSGLFNSVGNAQYDALVSFFGAIHFSESPVTIAAGVIAQDVGGIIHTITGEGAVADTLDTITELSADNWFMLLRCADPSEPITISHGTGNILCVDDEDIILDHASKFAFAIRDESIASAWRVSLIGGGGTGGPVTHEDVDTTGMIQPISVSAGSMDIPLGSTATKQTLDSGSSDIGLVVIDFDPTSIEYAVFLVWMPENWDGGTIEAAFSWLTSSSTNTHTCRWGLQGRSYGTAETLNQAYGTAQFVDSNATSVANQVIFSDYTPAITLAGTPAAGQIVLFRVQRDPTHANDDLNVDARLMGLRIRYGITSLSVS